MATVKNAPKKAKKPVSGKKAEPKKKKASAKASGKNAKKQTDEETGQMSIFDLLGGFGG